MMEEVVWNGKEVAALCPDYSLNMNIPAMTTGGSFSKEKNLR